MTQPGKVASLEVRTDRSNDREFSKMTSLITSIVALALGLINFVVTLVLTLRRDIERHSTSACLHLQARRMAYRKPWKWASAGSDVPSTVG